MSQHIQLRDRIQKEIILMDGSMGTYYNRLYPEDGEAEYANESHPERIVKIHKEYLYAGAQVIRTNTFAVNHMLLPYGDIREHLSMAVQCAKNAVAEYCKETASDRAIDIAASIGPIRYCDEKEEEDVLEEYQMITETLLEHGIRIFVFETFDDWKLIKKVAEYLKAWGQERQEDVFILAQFSVNRGGFTQAGYSMQRLAAQLEQIGVFDAFGFNCGIGAAHMNQLLGKLHFQKDCILSALPNAGYDHMLRGKRVYIDHPDYYAEMMRHILENGVNVVGGCCGTTPEYIKMLADVIQEYKVVQSKKIEIRQQDSYEDTKPNAFIEKLNQGQRVYVVEIDSPFNGKADKFLEAGYQLKENQVDLVTISDSPMARPRAEAFEMGIYLANQTGLKVMPHVCCRDRNVIALRSAMLGGYINGIRDMLIITGDPVARDDRGTVSAVFDFNSIKLMDYVTNMNAEVFHNEPFYFGGALNYAGVNIDAIVTRMRKKMEAGCSYFLTQPVYSDEDISRVQELKEKTGAKIILGIMPLVSYKNAVFMKNEMPGISVPDTILKRYSPDMSREAAEQVAEEICVEIGKKAMNYADGFYLMTPFNRVGLVNRIINQLREADKQETVDNYGDRKAE